MMRGRALAGASGDRETQIFCTNLMAERPVANRAENIIKFITLLHQTIHMALAAVLLARFVQAGVRVRRENDSFI